MRKPNDMRTWKTIGIIATIVIVMSFPLYLVNKAHRQGSNGEMVAGATASFTGSEKCRDCHRGEYDKWTASHHRMAMAVATEETVLGDFNDAVFDYFGQTSRFYRKDGKFFVHTRGPGGEPGDFEITHTFGWFPLQQYLVPFPGGRLQCLPIAWDAREKRWYHLQPDAPLPPDDWLYWTNAGQNWNGMCAECHSTDLDKNFDLETETYQTTWSEISVGCEACHGPGSRHVAWAQMPDMARPRVENFELTVKTANLSPRQQIELCAPCHSRRMSLGDNTHENITFMDYAVPQLLSEGYYFADGQILEEVYVYGSFMQSKMYHRDVRCSDCHDVHSTRRIQEKNALCLQCHRAAEYDTQRHHFHKKAGEKGQPIRSEAGEVLFEVGSGAQCEQCHMPGRTYMGIDYRPDHSFRIPRPDLSLTINTPNACNRCHIHKRPRWSEEYIQKWYGQRKRPHYGTLLDAGRRRQADAEQGLVLLVNDRLYPANVRATALSLLADYPGPQIRQAFETALADEEPLVRQTAVRHLVESDPKRRIQLLGPLLYDTVKAVRIEAAQNLAAVSTEMMGTPLRERQRRALDEYRTSMEYTADFAASRHNLGNLYTHLGETDRAVANYRKAIEIDPLFYPAKVNLAMLHNQLGDNAAAERLLREVVRDYPDLYDVHYSLALLLAEEKKYADAAEFMQTAARGLPQRARVHYNYGLLLQALQRDAEAEASLKRALALEPDNLDFLYALADFYLKRQRWDAAGRIARKMVQTHPDQKVGRDILDFLERNTATRP
jgi:tetratricopeptide (TPR) repeat protein